MNKIIEIFDVQSGNTHYFTRFDKHGVLETTQNRSTATLFPEAHVEAHVKNVKHSLIDSGIDPDLVIVKAIDDKKTFTHSDGTKYNVTQDTTQPTVTEKILDKADWEKLEQDIKTISDEELNLLRLTLSHMIAEMTTVDQRLADEIQKRKTKVAEESTPHTKADYLKIKKQMMRKRKK
jgi:hypothetical protein